MAARMRTFSMAGVAALLAAGLGAPEAARAADNRDVMCQAIRRLEDGNFTYRVESGLSVLALARAPGPFVFDNGGDVVAFSCMRTEAMPEVDDVEVLQAGYGLYIGSLRTGMRMIKLALADRRVGYELIGGELSGRERRDLDRIVAAMQARVDAAPPAAAPL